MAPKSVWFFGFLRLSRLEAFLDIFSPRQLLLHCSTFLRPCKSPSVEPALPSDWGGCRSFFAPSSKPSESRRRRVSPKGRKQDAARSTSGQGCPVGGPSETSVERGHRLGLPAQRQGSVSLVTFLSRQESNPPYGAGAPLIPRCVSDSLNKKALSQRLFSYESNLVYTANQ